MSELINTNIADNQVISNLDKVSAGQRITKASDDSVGLSLGTIDKYTLKNALVTTGQSDAVLGVADGAASGIQDTLTRLKSLAAQANMGSSSDFKREFSNQEFEELVLEIDRLVDEDMYKDFLFLPYQNSINSDLEPNIVSTSSNVITIDYNTF